MLISIQSSRERFFVPHELNLSQKILLSSSEAFFTMSSDSQLPEIVQSDFLSSCYDAITAYHSLKRNDTSVH